MAILVTGGAGFIGSKIIERLSMSGKRVVAIDDFNDYYSIDLKRARARNLLRDFGVRVLDMDIADFEKLRDIIKSTRPHSVIHLAAQAGVRLPVSQTHRYVHSNLQGFSNVLIESIRQDVPNILYASSSSVYGNSKNLPYSESDLSLHPLSFYGATKLSNELLAASLVRNSNSRIRGLRFFTVYGSWGRPDMAYFRLVDSALNGTSFTLFGDGEVRRDFTFIDDVTDSVEKLLFQLELESIGFHDVVNVGGGNPASMNEMIRLIASYSISNLNIVKIEQHMNDVQNTESDPSYLESLIGSIPKTKLQDGLPSVIEWAREGGVRENLTKWISSTV